MIERVDIFKSLGVSFQSNMKLPVKEIGDYII